MSTINMHTLVQVSQSDVPEQERKERVQEQTPTNLSRVQGSLA